MLPEGTRLAGFLDSMQVESRWIAGHHVDWRTGQPGLLADALCRWLEGEGRQSGWEAVATPLEAQELANRGMLVVACYVDPDPAIPGHIAIVRPEALSRRHSESYGPQVTQAGVVNYRSTSLAEGFRHHPGAWSRRAIRFYAHAAFR